MDAVDPSVRTFIDNLPTERRQREADTLLGVFGRVTGLPAELHGTIIGFGTYHYRYESGREGDSPAAAFSPRKAAISVYLPDGVGAHEDLLARLGPHKTGVGCLYIANLDKVDLDVLEEIVTSSWNSVSSGTFYDRARDSSNA